MTFYVLEHARCGHFGGLADDRRTLEGRRRIAVGAGYHHWRVRELAEGELVAAIAQIVAGPCSTCRMDASRGQLPAARKAAAVEVANGNVAPLTLHFRGGVS